MCRTGFPTNQRFVGERRSDGVSELSAAAGSKRYKVRDDEGFGVYPNKQKKPPVSARAEIGGFQCVYIHTHCLPVTLTQKSYKKIGGISPKPVEISRIVCYTQYV